MIYVPKPKRMAPPDFLAKARAEMEAVVPLFSRPHHKPPKYKYKAYRTPTLVAVLEKLFQGKCAYCEAIYADTGYVEVEHYRPKKIYYWLAADWTNLLPSCKKCNNGKMSKFPLMNSAQQAARRGVEKREQPLLLNPSDPAPARRPEKHLRFNPADGAISAALIHGQESPIGATSIKVYRLSRKELSDRRRDWATRVQGAIVFCKLTQEAGTPPVYRKVAEQGLRDVLAPTQPFRALTVQILRQNGIRERVRH